MKIYQRGLETEDLQKEIYLKALKELSFLHKKHTNIEIACSLWEQAAQSKQIYAHVELSKVFEHRKKDYATAIQWTKDAITIVSDPTFPVYERATLLPALEHRLNRLMQKSRKSG